MANRNQKAGGALAGAALAAAISLVGPWEGRESTVITTPDGKRYVAYKDIVGVWTACDGITRGIKPNSQYTAQQCDALLAAALQEANGYINKCITVELNYKTRAALVSGVHNLGPSLVCGSSLQKLFNAGDQEGGCLQLPRWNHAGGQVVAGLTKRRKDEMRVCLAGVTP